MAKAQKPKHEFVEHRGCLPPSRFFKEPALDRTNGDNSALLLERKFGMRNRPPARSRDIQLASLLISVFE